MSVPLDTDPPVRGQIMPRTAIAYINNVRTYLREIACIAATHPVLSEEVAARVADLDQRAHKSLTGLYVAGAPRRWVHPTRVVWKKWVGCLAAGVTRDARHWTQGAFYINDLLTGAVERLQMYQAQNPGATKTESGGADSVWPDPSRPASKKRPGTKKGKGTWAMLMKLVQDEPACLGWSSRQIARRLGCSHTTLIGLRMWPTFQRLQEQERLRRRGGDGRAAQRA